MISFAPGKNDNLKKWITTVLRKTLAIQGNGEKGKLYPYMPVFHLYMFFDDFLRTRKKQKANKFGWDSLEKNIGDPGIWGKRKNMPVFHFANNAP